MKVLCIAIDAEKDIVKQLEDLKQEFQNKNAVYSGSGKVNNTVYDYQVYNYDFITLSAVT